MSSGPTVPPETRRAFLDILAETANATAAAEMVGIGRTTPYYWRSRDPDVASAWAAALEARRDRLAEKVDRHIESHLDMRWVPLQDDAGNPVLDDEFEPVLVSAVELKELATIRRAIATAVPASLAAIQVNNLTSWETPPRPKLVQPINDGLGFDVLTMLTADD